MLLRYPKNITANKSLGQMNSNKENSVIMKMQINRWKFCAAINLFHGLHNRKYMQFVNGQVHNTTFAQYFLWCKINYNMLL